VDTITAIRQRRTVRKFEQKPVSREVLAQIVDCARLAPQGANLQPMKYVAVNDPEQVRKINQMVRWAAYIAPAGNPQQHEQPAAYVALVVDTDIKKTGYDVDAGAAGATLILAAQALGLGSCWLGNIDRDDISALLNLRPGYVLHTMVALGYPAESPAAFDEAGSIRYFKDASGRLHVPKRRLNDVLAYNRFE
jgi:nitroreductase